MLHNVLLILAAMIIGRIAALLSYRWRNGRWTCPCEEVQCDGWKSITPKKLDRKFRGAIIKNKDGSLVPPNQWIVFLAKDNAVPAMLQFYRSECQAIGAEREQIEAVDGLIRRVKHWRIDNDHLCKIPDVEPDELIP